MRPFEIIVTAGPALFPPGRLERMVELGATIVRLNGAHLDWSRSGEILADLRRRIGSARLLLDLSGRKVRMTALPGPLRFEAGDPVELARGHLNFPEVFDQAAAGDQGTAVDGIIRMQGERAAPEGMTLRALTAGTLSNGKGFHCGKPGLKLPPISLEEEARIRAVGKAVDLFGLSFVHGPGAVDHVQACLGDVDPRRILPKIETAEALAHLGAIVARAGEVLIDRGDLASEIGMARTVPAVREVIRSCKQAGKPVYLATHFLRSMVENPVPTMSEYFDLSAALSWGVDGIQFSDETAIGAHPERCLQILREAIGSDCPIAIFRR